jgi:hypothetical protein
VSAGNIVDRGQPDSATAEISRVHRGTTKRIAIRRVARVALSWESGRVAETGSYGAPMWLPVG